MSVDAAIAWREKRDSLPPGGTVVSPDDITLLLDNVEMVLRALATMPRSEEGDALADRAHACEREARDWQSAPPARPCYDAMTQRVLGLHIALRKMKTPDA